MKHSPHRVTALRAFTLVEMLVAMTVFLLISAMVIGLTDGTMRVTTQSQRRANADESARQVLDRFSADLSNAIIRSDLPFRFEKKEGNDSITFFAAAEGYTAGRGISMIGYRIVDNVLQRGVQAVSWNSGNPNGLPFKTTSQAASDADYLVIDEVNYENISSDVFRMELAFLMGNGSIALTPGTSMGSGSAYVANMATAPNANAAELIRGIIIGVAALDERSRNLLPEGTLDNLTGRFLDAAVDTEFPKRWEDFLTDNGTSLPTAARQGTRFYQRHIFLKR